MPLLSVALISVPLFTVLPATDDVESAALCTPYHFVDQ
jgi:hypothetical protein